MLFALDKPIKGFLESFKVVFGRSSHPIWSRQPSTGACRARLRLPVSAKPRPSGRVSTACSAFREAYIRGQAHAGWTVIRSRDDHGGYSSGSTERPALQRLLADVRTGKLDVVVVYKVDRLPRSLADFVPYHRLEQHEQPECDEAYQPQDQEHRSDVPPEHQAED